MPESSIFDYLSKFTLADVTTELLDSASKVTNIDQSNLEFWQGVITVRRILEDSRTYPHGLPIPESGVVHIETIANGADATLKPPGTEIWRVQNIDLDNCSIAFEDSDGNESTITTVFGGQYQGPTFSVPLYLSASMGLKFYNASGGEQTPSIAYHKVSL